MLSHFAISGFSLLLNLIAALWSMGLLPEPLDEYTHSLPGEATKANQLQPVCTSLQELLHSVDPVQLLAGHESHDDPQRLRLD